MTFETLEDAIDAFGITEPVVPKWIPERFSLAEVAALYNANGIEILATYVENGKSAKPFTVSYRALTQNMSIVEKDGTAVELYTQSGFAHYLITDVSYEQAIWQNGELECFISGVVSRQEMREIIDSIYEE